MSRASFRATSCACWLSWSVRRLQSLSRGATGFDAQVLQRHAVDAVRKRGDACRHRTTWTAEGVYHSEMVGAGDFLVTRDRHALSPGLGDRFALAQELARFQRANDGVQAASGRHVPIEWRYPARFGLIETQIQVLRAMHQRRKIEYSGDRIGGRHEVGRRIGCKSFPVLRHHASGKMSAGRMTVDADALTPLAPEGQASAAHLFDDVGNRTMRAKIVTHNRDRYPARIRSCRHLRKR